MIWLYLSPRGRHSADRVFLRIHRKGHPTGHRYAPIYAEIARWRRQWSRNVKPTLSYAIEGDRLSILDAREPEAPRAYKFDGLATRVYEFCSDTHRSLANIRDHLGDETVSDNALREVLGLFLLHGLICEDDGTFLSLALPRQPGL